MTILLLLLRVNTGSPGRQVVLLLQQAMTTPLPQPVRHPELNGLGLQRVLLEKETTHLLQPVPQLEVSSRSRRQVQGVTTRLLGHLVRKEMV
jgi:hypothetical protein